MKTSVANNSVENSQKMLTAGNILTAKMGALYQSTLTMRMGGVVNQYALVGRKHDMKIVLPLGCIPKHTLLGVSNIERNGTYF